MKDLMVSDKKVAFILAKSLMEFGTREVVLCPGSRNAPLVLTFSQVFGEKAITVIDERSAAFIALGMAARSNRMVAIVCTSGSAILNMSPAIAEAFYRQIPLIAISADRPQEWLNQDDSQTILQAGVLSPFVKASFDLAPENASETCIWNYAKTISDALNAATEKTCGPVHINVQLDVPLSQLMPLHALEKEIKGASIKRMPTAVRLSREILHECAQKVKEKRTLLIFGGMPPKAKLQSLIKKLAMHPQIGIMTECQANLPHERKIVSNIDGFLASMNSQSKDVLRPDLVITLGGPLVSRNVKSWLRGQGIEHWHVGTDPFTPDCFQSMRKLFEMEAFNFLEELIEELSRNQDLAFSTESAQSYSKQIESQNEKALAVQKAFSEKMDIWSDFQALDYIISSIPNEWEVQFSNGTPIRYAQLFCKKDLKRVDCNRGVSGIDGCTSTAIGASLINEGVTLLVTGDMSAQYDLGALAFNAIPSKFKIVVINNGGGSIFRFIPSTRNLPCVEKRLCVGSNLPVQKLADAFGFSYFEAMNMQTLKGAWASFVKEQEKPSILHIITNGVQSTEVLCSYFKEMAITNS